jgi:D-beta-D-heptose 7-phosphate kinase/D-beta-D-heptose 1-phosphate adenosyltransferase
VVGYFDPLQAAHVRRLNEVRRSGGPLVVAVANPADPILPLAARLQLVAGLRAVDKVVPLEDGLEEIVQVLSPDELLDEREPDLARTGTLVAEVLDRHRRT